MRARRRIADAKPDWALSAAGLAGLRGRGGRARDEDASDREKEANEPRDVDGEDSEPDGSVANLEFA
jgi:hypothetical protein